MDEDRGKGRGERFQQSIDELEARITELAERARRAGGELRARLLDEESELRQRLDEARRRFREVREASGDGIDEVRSGLERLWADVRDAWERSGTATSRAAGAEGTESEPSAEAATGGGESDPLPPSMRPPGTSPRTEDW
jgi:ElaB/YqjD/DUF883 family membrane-anchored ribosome-binding protein